VTVSQRCRDVYADIQSHLYDVVDWSLERLSPVSHSDAARLSVQHMGCYQRAAGRTVLFGVINILSRFKERFSVSR